MNKNALIYAKKLSKQPRFSQVIQDFMAFTGMTFEQVAEKVYSTRKKIEAEYSAFNPESDQEITNFYRSSKGHIYHCIDRPFWDRLEKLTSNASPLLDFGAGIGNNTVILAKRNIQVTFCDINVVQTNFMKFRAMRHKIKVDFMNPFERPDGYFMTIILQDVLEHIPNYHLVLEKLIAKLSINGLIYERSPFVGTVPNAISMHLKASMPIAKAMEKFGMKLHKNLLNYSNVWVKIR